VVFWIGGPEQARAGNPGQTKCFAVILRSYLRRICGFSALLTVDVSETGEPIFASRFTGQASRAGNISGNIHANPPTSMKSSDPVFKPFSDVRGSPWTRLGITGVRLPSPPSAL
jgi:hypothetical protein